MQKIFFNLGALTAVLLGSCVPTVHETTWQRLSSNYDTNSCENVMQEMLARREAVRVLLIGIRHAGIDFTPNVVIATFPPYPAPCRKSTSARSLA